MDISEKAFLLEHKKIYDKFLGFADKHDLIVLDNVGLIEKTMHDGEPVGIYYKYFDRTMDDPLKTHYNN